MTCTACGNPVDAGRIACECGALIKRVPKPKAPGGSGKLKKTYQLKFHGDGGDLFLIHLVNLALTLVTLGVYHFWAKVKVRQYLFAQLELEGERFGYHGNGKELLVGWLKVAGIFAVAMAFNVGMTLQKEPMLAVVGFLIFYGVMLALVPVAIVGSRKYLLARTSLFGIRFSFRGNVKDFLKLFVPNALLTAVTFGLYFPFMHAKLHNYLVSHSYFGNKAFKSKAEGKALFKDFLIAVVLHIPTFSLIWWWYRAKQQRYYASTTTFAGGRFESSATGGSLLKLNMVNGLILMFTGGLGYPFVAVRQLAYTVEHLRMRGNVDFAAITQEAQRASATGDGLAEALELDVGLGL
jgi:uncharacterized membrane protein YjgN (DUF898 family)